ncbi:O-antigen ligase family protein [Pontitalea aquivivens]|uniref:O-antigen ligase family protein n=1 Tax=Pontitalea aquivivens TaxID=3388663 RepID=UPI0039708350
MTAGDRMTQARMGLAGGVLVAFVLVTPLAVGGNRAPVWLIGAVVACALAGHHVARGGGVGRVANLRPVLVPILLFLAFAGVQILPVAAPMPQAVVALPETGVPPAATISLAPGAGQLAILRIAGSLALFVMLIQAAARPDQARRIGWVIYAGVVGHALWGLLSLALFGDQLPWGEKQFYRGAVTGTFVSRNAFATFLGMGATLGLALLLGGRGQSARGGWLVPSLVTRAALWATLGIVLLALLGTQSRMGLVATVAGLALVALAMPGGRRRGTGWAGLGGFALLLFVAGAGLADRAILMVGDAAHRLELWRQVAAMIRARPWTGYGLDAFAPAFELHHRPVLEPGLIWDHAHSVYLTLWAEMGLIAGSLPPLAGLLAARRLVRLRLARPGDSLLPVAGLGALCVAAVHSLADFSLEVQGNVLLLLSILALGLARRLPEERDRTAGAGA